MIFERQNRDDVLRRFEDKFIPEPMSGCWLWDAGIDGCGYGSFHIKDGMKKSHRVAFELYKHEIPQGMHVLHKCDMPACVNPDHLFLGTHQDNMRDRNKKGRCASQSGELNGRAKLTEKQVLEIRKLYGAGDWVYKNLAIKYNIDISVICDIVNRKIWVNI